MNALDNFIVIGRLGRPQGIHGLIRVHSFTEPRENILNYHHWHFFIDKRWQALDIIRFEVNDKHILAQISGFEEREQVQKLTNIDIGVDKSQLPTLSSGEFYWHQLLGLSVLNPQGDSLGRVIDILATGSNDVLIVSDEREPGSQNKKRVLIPYLPGETIIDVDLQQKKIIVEWDWDF